MFHKAFILSILDGSGLHFNSSRKLVKLGIHLTIYSCEYDKEGQKLTEVLNDSEYLFLRAFTIDDHILCPEVCSFLSSFLHLWPQSRFLSLSCC